jgi:hypothetical protein
MAQSVVNQLDSGNHSALQQSLRGQNNATSLHSQRPLPTNNKPADSSPESQNKQRTYSHSSSSTIPKNVGAHQRAILAYQEAARFEGNNEAVFSIGNLFVNESSRYEQEMTNLLRAEPENSAAWADLGLFYHGQGQRDKVSAIYQILQTFDAAKAEAFSIKVGLHEKVLFNIA